jgi:N-terminal domain of toast_rack, DUF2154
MNRKLFLIPIVFIALVSLACSVTFNLPETTVKTGPTVTENINVPPLTDKTATANVTLGFGAGKLNLTPGSADALISGTVSYNVTDFKPVVTINNADITIEQGNLKVKGLPALNSKIVNEWDLALGTSPMDLSIKAGAYEGSFDLGGLSIRSLDVTDGASKVNVNFSKPNLVEMTTFKYSTGASAVSVKGLGDANVSDMTFSSGAGSYTLDFGGQLQRDMTVTIESGVSSVTIIIPNGVPVLLSNDSNFVSVSTSGAWNQVGNTYQLPGSGYKITILTKMGAGSLKLETSR